MEGIGTSVLVFHKPPLLLRDRDDGCSTALQKVTAPISPPPVEDGAEELAGNNMEREARGR